MENKYAESFTDYLKGNVKKYMIFISRRQYAIIKADADHGDMAKSLISKMRPSEKMDAIGNPLDENNSHYNDTIGLLGYRKPCYMQIIRCIIIYQSKQFQQV